MLAKRSRIKNATTITELGSYATGDATLNTSDQGSHLGSIPKHL